MQIRNFSIIAHIDHGKSTLADRLLQATKAVTERESRDQLLDSMDLERERGITIKASAVTVHHTYKGEDYELNFIDTPGHVDFTYEVSRALTACEGALLVVDSVPRVLKLKLSQMHTSRSKTILISFQWSTKLIYPLQIQTKLRWKLNKFSAYLLRIASTVLQKLVRASLNCSILFATNLPPPEPAKIKQTRALIFDSHYDEYRGVVVYFRIFDGALKKGDRILMMGTGRTFTITELGRYTPISNSNK